MKVITEEQKDKAKELLDSIAPATRFWVDATQTGIIKAEEKAIIKAMQQYAEWYAESLLPSEDVRNYFTLNKRFLKEWDTIRSRILDAIK